MEEKVALAEPRTRGCGEVPGPPRKKKPSSLPASCFPVWASLKSCDTQPRQIRSSAFLLPALGSERQLCKNLLTHAASRQRGATRQSPVLTCIIRALLHNVSEAEPPGPPAQSCHYGGWHLEPEEMAVLLKFGLLSQHSN